MIYFNDFLHEDILISNLLINIKLKCTTIINIRKIYLLLKIFW